MIDTDLMLVVGIFCLILAAPSLLSAFVDSRVPRAGAILILVGGVLLAVALTRHPGGYRFDQIPHIFYQVIGRYLN